jgi:hypothetical protein
VDIQSVLSHKPGQMGNMFSSDISAQKGDNVPFFPLRLNPALILFRADRGKLTGKAKIMGLKKNVLKDRRGNRIFSDLNQEGHRGPLVNHGLRNIENIDLILTQGTSENSNLSWLIISKDIDLID